MCASCSSKTSQFWDEKKRWTSAQRVCDACARRREAEVAVGTGNKIDHALSTQNVTMIIVIRSARELTYARQSGSLWGDRGSRSLSCSLSVGGKNLGQTTTKMWSAADKEGKTKV